MYRVVTRTAAAVEPVSLTEAKDQLRLEAGFVLDDAYIQRLISAARDRCERYCNNYFTVQTVEIIYDGDMSAGSIALPYPNITAVDAIKYTVDGVKETLSDTTYTVDLDEARIYPDDFFPADVGSYSITITTAPPVEMASAKAAILLIVTDLYENRTEHVVGAAITINSAVESMLWQYRQGLGV